MWNEFGWYSMMAILSQMKNTITFSITNIIPISDNHQFLDQCHHFHCAGHRQNHCQCQPSQSLRWSVITWIRHTQPETLIRTLIWHICTNLTYMQPEIINNHTNPICSPRSSVITILNPTYMQPICNIHTNPTYTQPERGECERSRGGSSAEHFVHVSDVESDFVPLKGDQVDFFHLSF